MKKLLAVGISILIFVSIFSLNVLAGGDETIESITIQDAYVYDGMQNEDGKFEEIALTLTVFYQNGEEGKHWFQNEIGGSCELPYGVFTLSNIQEGEVWEAGNKYQLTATYAGCSDTFEVEVRENPYVSMDIDDLYITKMNYTHEDKGWRYYYNPQATFYCGDDTTETTRIGYGVYLDEMRVDAEFSDTQDTEKWEVGNTYQVTCSVLGLTDTFNVHVVEVESIEINDVKVIENIHGYMQNEYDDYHNIIGSYFEYNIYPENIVINFKNGLYISGDYWEIYDYLDCNPDLISDQSYVNQWGVGKHTAKFVMLETETNYTVEVLESPVVSMTATPIELIENHDGYYDDSFFYYELYAGRSDVTITLKDGTVLENIGSVIEYDNDYYEIDCYIEQSKDNPLLPGNTYYATLSCFGKTCTVPVRIIECPIEKIEIEDVSIMEYTKGCFVGDDYHYEWFDLDVTTTFKDGSVQHGTTIQFNGYGYSLQTDTSSQYDEPWVAGKTYTVTGSFLGVESTFNVTITECPVKSIDIKDLSVMEHYNGYYQGDVFIYNGFVLEAVVTFKDGSTKEIQDHYEIGDEWYSIETNVYELQQNEPWTAGNTYEVTGTFLGAKDTFKVTITESPIKSIVIEDIVLVEGFDSDNFGGMTEYYLEPVLSEVILKDGTKAEIVRDNAIIYNQEYYYVETNSRNLQTEEPWEAGKTYEVTGFLLGTSTKFKVTIKENPIKDVQIVKMPDKVEYLIDEQVNLKGVVIRVLYKDGSYEDISIDKDYSNAYRRYVYCKKIQRYGTLYINSDWEKAGNNIAEFELFGIVCEIPLVVRDNLMQSISIKENADKTITITVKNSDKSSYDMKLIDISYIWLFDEDAYYAGILTDKGEFDAMFYFSEGSFAIGFVDFEAETEIKSNTLSSCEWFETVAKSYNYSWAMTCHYDMDILETSHFNGKITADNIDDIISFAASTMIDYENAEIWLSPDGEEYMVYAGKDVRDAVDKLFGIKNVDLTLSKNYDSKNDTYKTTKFPRSGAENRKCSPSKISYSGGIWTVESSHEFMNGEKTVYLKLNDKQNILSFSIEDYVDKSLNGWQNQNGGWYYYENGKKVKNTWKQDSKGWVYLGSDGKMLTNDFAKDSYGWCYVGADGYCVTTTGWKQVNGGWYYLEKGYRVENTWKKDSKGWCYVGSDGRMVTNDFAKDSSGWCYMGADGYYVTATGWKQVNGAWYFLNNGYRLQNSWKLDGGKWYYLGADGKMYANAWMKDSKGWVYLGANGAMVTNDFARDSKGWCYMGADGYYVTTTGWKKHNGHWYYLKNGYRVESSWMKDSIGWCYLGADGKMLTNTYINDSKGKCYLDASGYWDGKYVK